MTSVSPMPGGGYDYVYDEKGGEVDEYVPPAGFDPLDATADQLEEYGFPQKPTDPVALMQWETEMGSWKGAAVPSSFLSSSNSQSTSVTSPNWSGYVILLGAGAFTHAEALYTEPTFSSSRCQSNAETTWAGVGGWNNTTLGQAGTSHNVPGIGNHQAFWEVWPYNDMQPVLNFSAHAGYEFDASARYLGNGWRFYYFDYYTDTSKAFDETAFPEYSGNSADAIAERPKINGSYSNLSNFETMQFESSQADGNSFDTYSGEDSGPRRGVHMVNGGTELATPSPINNGGDFTVTQNSCN